MDYIFTKIIFLLDVRLFSLTSYDSFLCYSHIGEV